MDIRIKAEMTEGTFKKIPPDIREEMIIKTIDAPNMRDLYKGSKDWVKANKDLSEAIKARIKIEDELRANNKIN